MRYFVKIYKVWVEKNGEIKDLWLSHFNAYMNAYLFKFEMSDLRDDGGNYYLLPEGYEMKVKVETGANMPFANGKFTEYLYNTEKDIITIDGKKCKKIKFGGY